MIITKEDIFINSDGTVSILNEELKAKIENISGPNELMHAGDNCRGGNCASGCGGLL